MVPLLYVWFWALVPEAGISNAWYSLLHPPSMFVWTVLFTVADIVGRRKWSSHDLRKKLPTSVRIEGTSSDANFEAEEAQHAPVPGGLGPAVQPPRTTPSTMADTKIVRLIGILAAVSVSNMCK